jgi:hypothetical protein
MSLMISVIQEARQERLQRRGDDIDVVYPPKTMTKATEDGFMPPPSHSTPR